MRKALRTMVVWRLKQNPITRTRRSLCRQGSLLASQLHRGPLVTACPAEAARQSEVATSESGFAGRPEWKEFAEHTRRGEFDSPQFKEGLEKLKLSQESLALMDQIMLSVKMRRARHMRA